MATRDDPFAVLGIAPTRDEYAIRRAWRERARSAHPDAGGSNARMTLVNGALERALEWARDTRPDAESDGATGAGPAARRRHDQSRARRDLSSFTIEVPPREAFPALEIVAAEVGSVIHDERPNMIEFTLHQSVLDEGGQSWCRCELVPESGGTTVHVTVGSEPASAAPSVDQVRDVLVAALNSIDWPRPSEDGRTRHDPDRGRAAGPPR